MGESVHSKVMVVEEVSHILYAAHFETQVSVVVFIRREDV